MEKYLTERRTTVSYRDGLIFRKYYKHANKAAITAEIDNSIRMLENGVNCPKPLGIGYSELRQMFYSEFEFKNIKPIDRKLVDEDTILEALHMADKMPECKSTWSCCLQDIKEEILSISYYLPTDRLGECLELADSIDQMKKKRLIHGDYSFENIGWDLEKRKLIVFDFFDSKVGIDAWDKSYLLASIPNKDCSRYVPEDYYKYIKIISAIKYARGLRKNIEVEERRDIYEFWWGK